MIKKIINKIIRTIRRIRIKLSFKSIKSGKSIRYEKCDKIIDFEQFKKIMDYKDEKWNYISNLQEYLVGIQKNKIISFENNEMTEKKYKIVDGKIVSNTRCINNNWICFYINDFSERKYELNYDITINSEFEEIQIAFRYKNLGTRYRFMIRDNEEVVFECVNKGRFYNRLYKKNFKLELGKKYNIKLVVYEKLFLYYINDKLIYSIKEMTKLSSGDNILLIFYNKDNKRNVNYELSNLEIYRIK